MEQMPEVWWFFKNLSSVTFSEQVKAAEAHGIDDLHWLGQHPMARFRNCQNLRKLVFTKQDRGNKRNRNIRPIKKYDTVWVYNIFCLGYDVRSIWKTIALLHDNRISLHIHSLGYFDDRSEGPPECKALSKKHDYDLIYELLGELASRSYKRFLYQSKPANKNVGGPGRHRYNICYANLSESGKKAIHKYCTTSEKTRDEALEDMRNFGLPKDQPGTISKNRFHSLVREYKEILKAQGKGEEIVQHVRRKDMADQLEQETEKEKEKAQS